MKSRRYRPGATHLLSLERGDDIVDTITAYATANRIQAAWFTYLGAVSRAAVRYFDQNELVYRDFVLDRHLEVLSGVGNISLRDGAPFVHTHAAFGDADGSAWGGHLNQGCLVFALEMRIEELEGDPPVRVADPVTGLSLWDLE
jgi:predicted DNA-binding protein with PD1-like motif